MFSEYIYTHGNLHTRSLYKFTQLVSSDAKILRSGIAGPKRFKFFIIITEFVPNLYPTNGSKSNSGET
jgi:hypothetical protein